jgi:hypothetical protein
VHADAQMANENFFVHEVRGVRPETPARRKVFGRATARLRVCCGAAPGFRSVTAPSKAAASAIREFVGAQGLCPGRLAARRPLHRGPLRRRVAGGQGRPGGTDAQSAAEGRADSLSCGTRWRPARYSDITTRNAWTMPQERWNTEWVQQHGLGLVLRRFGEVDEAVPQLLAELPAYRQRVQAQRNQAVFEVSRILERILREAS